MTKPKSFQPGEKEIVEGILMDDEETLGYIYQEGFPSIKSEVLANSGNEADAFDIFQEAVVQFCQAVKNGSYQPQNWKAFLFTIGKRLWRKELRKRKKRQDYPIYPGYGFEETPYEWFGPPGIPSLMKEHLLKLQADCRDILTKIFYEKVSREEIIKEYRYKPNYLSVKIYRCKDALKKSLLSDERFQYYMS